jgi:hypothetical protein
MQMGELPWQTAEAPDVGGLAWMRPSWYRASALASHAEAHPVEVSGLEVRFPYAEPYEAYQAQKQSMQVVIQAAREGKSGLLLTF